MRMMVGAAALAALVFGVAGSARAQTVDAAHVTHDPGATLLLPYFEAQVPKKVGGKAPGINTLFSINNSSATAVLAHVTLWTDLAVPVFAFNIYLTGFDVQTLDMVDLLNGKLPLTADDADDPGDTFSPNDGISNQGNFSQDINFPGSGASQPTQLDVDTVAHIRAALTGKPSALLGGQCTGRDFAEKKPIARGFVTVDVVNNWTTRLPNEVGYFISGGLGDVTFQNVLWGDYFFINKSKKIGRGDAMVAIRADGTDPQTTSPGEYSFYGRIVHAIAGGVPADNRQPLGSAFAGRFVNVPKHPLFPSGTSALVWRDPKVNQQPFTCGAAPAWFPLGQEQIVVFDEQENAEFSTALPFPAAAQIVKVGGPSFPVTPTAGWIFMNLNGFVAAAATTPFEDITAGQAFVSMIFESAGKYSIGARAIVMDDAAESQHDVLGD